MTRAFPSWSRYSSSKKSLPEASIIISTRASFHSFRHHSARVQAQVEGLSNHQTQPDSSFGDFECPNCSKRHIHSHSHHQHVTFHPVSAASSSSSAAHSQVRSTSKDNQGEPDVPEMRLKELSELRQSGSQSTASTSSPAATLSSFRSPDSASILLGENKPFKPPYSSSESHSDPDRDSSWSATSASPTFSLESQPLWSLSFTSSRLSVILEEAAFILLESFQRDRKLDKRRSNHQIPYNHHLLEALTNIQTHFIERFVPGSLTDEHQKEADRLKLEELNWLLIGKFLGREGHGIRDADPARAGEVEAETKALSSKSYRNQDSVGSASESPMTNEEDGVGIASSERLSSTSTPTSTQTHTSDTCLQHLNPQDSISIAFLIYQFFLDQSTPADPDNLPSTTLSNRASTQAPSCDISSSRTSSSYLNVTDQIASPSSLSSKSDMSNDHSLESQMAKPSREFTIHYLRRSTLHLLFGSLLNLSRVAPSSSLPLSSSDSFSPALISHFRKASILLRDQRLRKSHCRYLSRKLISMISKDLFGRKPLSRASPHYPLPEELQNQNQNHQYDHDRTRTWFELDGTETLIELNKSMNHLLGREIIQFFSLPRSSLQENSLNSILRSKVMDEVSPEIRSYLQLLCRVITFSSTISPFASRDPVPSMDTNTNIPPSPSSSILSTKLYNPKSLTSKIRFERKKKLGMIGDREKKLLEKEKGNRIREREEIMKERRLMKEMEDRIDETKWLAGDHLREFVKRGWVLSSSEVLDSKHLEKRKSSFRRIIDEVLQTLIGPTSTLSPKFDSGSTSPFDRRNSPLSDEQFNLNSELSSSAPSILPSSSRSKSSPVFDPQLFSRPALPSPPRHPIPIAQRIAFNLLIQSLPDDYMDKEMLSRFLRCESFSSAEMTWNPGSLESFQHGFPSVSSEDACLRGLKNFISGESSRSAREKARRISSWLVDKYVALGSSASSTRSAVLSEEACIELLVQILENRAMSHSRGRWELIPVPKEARKSWISKDQGITRHEDQTQVVKEQEMKLWIWQEGDAKALIRDLEFLEQFKLRKRSSRQLQDHTQIAISGLPNPQLEYPVLSSSPVWKSLVNFSEKVQFACIRMLARESKWNMVIEASLECLTAFEQKMALCQDLDRNVEGQRTDLDMESHFPNEVLNSLLEEALKRRPISLRFSDLSESGSREVQDPDQDQNQNQDQDSDPDQDQVRPSSTLTPAPQGHILPAENRPKARHRILKRSKRPTRSDAFLLCMKLLEAISAHPSKVQKVNEKTMFIMFSALNDWSRHSRRWEENSLRWSSSSRTGQFKLEKLEICERRLLDLRGKLLRDGGKGSGREVKESEIEK